MVSNIKRSPWNELDYYKEGQHLYGRDEEIRKTTNSIRENLTTTLYGQSGIGKSSLLFAGVFPRLRKEYYFPVFIRLGISKDNTYVDTVIKAILAEAEHIDKHIGKERIICEKIITLPQSEESNSAERLKNFIYSTKFTDIKGNEYVPVLVFDQFEEILNNAETYEKARTFLLDIYSLLDDTSIIPEGCVPYSNFRFVLSLREDYLYCLEDIIDKYNLSEFRYNRFRIAAMNDKNAKEVILNTSNEVGGCLEKGKENDICSRIIADSKNKMGEISTYMLSLICSTQYSNTKNGIILLDNLACSTDYLYQYYSSKFNGLEAIQSYLEDVLITSDGRRSSIDINDATVQQRLDEFTINKLVETRLIRKITSGDSCSRIEFIHDKLTEVINKKRKRSFWETLKYANANSFNFNGCASMQEYNTVFTFAFFAGFVFLYIVGFSMLDSRYQILDITDSWQWTILFISYYIFIFGLKLVIPTGVRRCHDIGISGWNVLNPFCLISMKPSSSVAYKGKLSKIGFGKLSAGSSINHIEYCSLFIKAIWSSYTSMAFTMPIISLFLYFCFSIDIRFLIILSIVVSCILPPLILYILVAPARLASSKLSTWWNFVPFAPIYFFIRGFFPYKDEQRIKYNRAAAILIPFFALILHIFLLIVFEGIYDFV